MAARQLSDFDVLTFDCYGTLIDWETGIAVALAALTARAKVGRDPALEAFAEVESDQEEATPALPYPALLARVYERLARRWNVSADAVEARAFGASVGDWPAFADSTAALAEFKRHCKLVILSNVDRESFRRSNRRLGVEFDAVFTAQDVGSYKPDARNFAYMIERLAAMGIAKGRILHTAQSLFHDHVPARAAGLATCWIDRRAGRPGFGATRPPAGDVTTDFRFASLAEMAAARARLAGG